MSKIVQIAVAQDVDRLVFAIRDDGTLWVTKLNHLDDGPSCEWRQMNLPPGTDTQTPWGLKDGCSDSST